MNWKKINPRLHWLLRFRDLRREQEWFSFPDLK